MTRPILIDGAWVPSQGSSTREIHNPATLEPMDTVADAGTGDVDAAVRAAAKAQYAWWKLPGVEKAKHLHEIAGRIRSRERDLSTLMTRETGKPLIEAVDCIDWVAASIRWDAVERRRPGAGRGGAGRLSRAETRPPRLRRGAKALLVSLPRPADSAQPLVAPTPAPTRGVRSRGAASVPATPP